MPKLLELFAGTGSVGKAARAQGWDVVSLDIEAGHTIQSDILAWDHTTYPPGYFDWVHGSPPCTQYSRARTRSKTPRDLDLADAIVQKTLDVIAYHRAAFTLENPFTGLMKVRPCMGGLSPFLNVVTYCSYGFPYKKQTAIWSNLGEFWRPRPACCKALACPNVVDGRHNQTAQRGPSKVDGVRRANDSFSLRELYALPGELCLELAQAATRAVHSERALLQFRNVD